MRNSTAHHRRISFQGNESFSLHPQEVVLVDRHHRRTEDPWQVFREKGGKIAKVVPTRRYEVERSPHALVVKLQEGVRINVFYHIIGKTPEDDEYSERHYLDHIHHIAFQVALDLGIDRRKLSLIKNNLKRERSRLRPEAKALVSDVREVLRRILLVGTTNLSATRGEYADPTALKPAQFDLFDERDENLDAEDEALEALCLKELAGEADEDGDFPLFSRAPTWDVKSVMWTPGSVESFLPHHLPHSKKAITSSVDATLQKYFQERLR